MEILTQDNITKIGSDEETVKGTINTTDAMDWPGVVLQWAIGDAQDELVIPDGDSEDIVRETLYGNKLGGSTLDFIVTNTTLIQWASKLKDGAGTPSKTRSFAAQVVDKGTTKYVLVEYALPTSVTIASGTGQLITASLSLVHEFTLPWLTAWTSKPTLATDPGKSTQPSYRFEGGGTQPVTIDGDDMPIASIAISIPRGLAVGHTSGDTTLAYNTVTSRATAFAIAMVRDSEADKVIKDYSDRAMTTDLVWTLKTGVAEITLADIWITGGIPIQWSSMPGEVPLTIMGGAVSATWTVF